MRLLWCALLLLDSLLGQSIADRMLARAASAQWGAAYAGGKTCQPRSPSQQAFGANDGWSDRCDTHGEGILEESFFYALDDSGPVRLRVVLRPEASAGVAPALREKLTAKFGAPVREPNMVAVGLPFAGEHWSGGELHYFLGGGVAVLLVVHARLFQEIQKDAIVQQADVLFQPADPARPFFQKLLGNYDIGLLDANPKTAFERQILARQTARAALGLLSAAGRALLDEKAMLLLAADDLIAKLSTLLWVNDAQGEHEIPDAAPIRAQLAKYGVTLGTMRHNNGVLGYKHDLLWRVWREFPESQAGQLAFVELQQRGWYNDSDKGCPANPDVFHDVIERGEAFLAQHPATPFRKEVLFTLAVANESWWSVAHAPADDPWVSAPPYPRKQLNKTGAEAARNRAIDYYQQVVTLAPESSEAASAERRLPRLKQNLDTGQRRFFCSYD